MATLSVRDIADDCLGVSGDLSVDSDVYGYIFRDTDGSVFGTLAGSDTLVGSGEATTRSLKRHLQTISGRAFDMVPILVDHENDFSGAVSRDDVTKIQYAVQITRDIYAQQNLGVRRLVWQRIPSADAGGYADLTDRSEAEDLADDWSGPNGGIDVFFVQTLGDAAGWSNRSGSCDKDSKDDLTGAVLVVGNSRRFTGVLVAHEVAHYLGLAGGNSATNLMGVNNPSTGIDAIGNNSTGLTNSQGTTIRGHCSVQSPC